MNISWYGFSAAESWASQGQTGMTKQFRKMTLPRAAGWTVWVPVIDWGCVALSRFMQLFKKGAASSREGLNSIRNTRSHKSILTGSHLIIPTDVSDLWCLFGFEYCMTPNFLNAFGDILSNIPGSSFFSMVLCWAVYQLKLRNKINVILILKKWVTVFKFWLLMPLLFLTLWRI